MANIKVELEEYTRLVKIEQSYMMLLFAIDESMKVNRRSWNSETYSTFDDNVLESALRLIEGDSFEALYQRKLAELEAEEGEEDVSE